MLVCVHQKLTFAFHSDADSTADGVANAVTLAAPDSIPHRDVGHALADNDAPISFSIGATRIITDPWAHRSANIDAHQQAHTIAQPRPDDGSAEVRVWDR